jgi:hypothetical protein
VSARRQIVLDRNTLVRVIDGRGRLGYAPLDDLIGHVVRQVLDELRGSRLVTEDGKQDYFAEDGVTPYTGS